ncbi:MAG: anthranilate synthase component II [Promethearchaeota archaeon]
MHELKLDERENQLDRISDNQNILFINNQDSFVYNLVNYVCSLSKSKIRVVSNKITIHEIESFKPDKIIISPGPGHPKYHTGNVINIIHHFTGITPILGICLGHQAICEAFGDDPSIEHVGKARVGPMHGKTSRIFHDGEGVLKSIPNPCTVVRYHSLAAKLDVFPSELKITATADDGTIMAIRHKKHEIHGVQFHPESILMKPHGIKIIKNFLEIP